MAPSGIPLIAGWIGTVDEFICMCIPVLCVGKPSELPSSAGSLRLPQGDNFLDVDVADVVVVPLVGVLLAPLAGVRRGAFLRLISCSNSG